MSLYYFYQGWLQNVMILKLIEGLFEFQHQCRILLQIRQNLLRMHWLEPPLHGHGADVPPASVQPSGGLLDGVALRLSRAGIAVVQQDFAQVQHRRHACAVFLYVPLQLLENIQNNYLIFRTHLIKFPERKQAHLASYIHSDRKPALLPNYIKFMCKLTTSLEEEQG